MFHFLEQILVSLFEFFTPLLIDGFSLESKWQQVSPGLPDSSKNSVVWMLLVLPLISSPSGLFFWALGTVLKAPPAIGITIVFMFNSFFNSLARSRYLYSFLLSFNFTLWLAGSRWLILFFLIKTKSSIHSWSGWSLCNLKFERIFHYHCYYYQSSMLYRFTFCLRRENGWYKN